MDLPASFDYDFPTGAEQAQSDRALGLKKALTFVADMALDLKNEAAGFFRELSEQSPNTKAALGLSLAGVTATILTANPIFLTAAAGGAGMMIREGIQNGEIPFNEVAKAKARMEEGRRQYLAEQQEQIALQIQYGISNQQISWEG